MKHTITKFSLTFVMVGVLALINPVGAFAATINLSPSTGTFPGTRPFTVDVVVDEKTDAFNAAQAQVTLSKNLTPTDLVLGDCEFSFVKTPTTQNPSFVGVTLGGSKKHCTVYSLTVIPTGTDDGMISFSEASVKRYGDAKELITAVSYGKYSVGNASVGTFLASILPGGNAADNQLVPVTNAAGTIDSGKDLSSYTVAVNVKDASNQPLKNAEVQLNPQVQSADTNITTIKAKTDDKGVATFTNVTPNVYTVKASEQDRVIAEAVINAKGNNQTLVLGIQDEHPQNLVGFIIVAALVVFAIIYLIRAKVWTFFHRSGPAPTQEK